jgi:hypothetical protein
MQTYKDAMTRHVAAREAEEIFRKKGFKADALWQAIVDVNEDPKEDSFAEAVKLAMPTDAIPIVRTLSGVAAAFVMRAAADLYDGKRDFMKLAREVWRAFEERQKLANNVEEGYGCDKAVSWELARDISDSPEPHRVNEIAKLAGRMYEVLSGVRKVPTNDPHEVKGVKLGDEIERLVSEEIAALSTPGLDDMAAIRILEKRAMQFRLTGKQAKSRGPLVICIDESGSMHDDGYAGRNTWAKACAVAMTRVAHDGDRMVKVVHFGTSCVAQELAPGDAKAVLDMSRHFLSGGTDIARALYVAAQEVGNLAQAGHVGADIVMITDGEDYSHPQQEKILALVQAQGVRLWTVAIECDISGKCNCGECKNKPAPLARRASELVRVGATDRADLVAALRSAADNTVSEEEVAAADEAARKAFDADLN